MPVAPGPVVNASARMANSTAPMMRAHSTLLRRCGGTKRSAYATTGPATTDPTRPAAMAPGIVSSTRLAPHLVGFGDAVAAVGPRVGPVAGHARADPQALAAIGRAEIRRQRFRRIRRRPVLQPAVQRPEVFERRRLEDRLDR